MPEISPQDAAMRVDMLSREFEKLDNRYIICSEGEDLFGLMQTPFPDVLRFRRDFKLLLQLYNLFNDVNHEIDAITEQLLN